MKKVFLLMLGIIFFIGGCKVRENEVYKMLDKVKEVADNELFLNYHIKGVNQSQDKIMEYELLKDNKNYFIRIDNEYYYIVENNNSYHVYESKNDIKKHYKKISPIEDILKVYTSRMRINVNMNNMHKNIVNHIEDLLSYCNENTTTCNSKKILFNRLQLEIIQEGDISKRISKYFMDNGKITHISSEYIEETIYLNNVLEITYNNQKIPKFDKSEYKIVNKNS